MAGRTDKGAKTTSLRIPPEDLDLLATRASELGFVQPRGAGARYGMGNVSALIRAIARGDIQLVRAQDKADDT